MRRQRRRRFETPPDDRPGEEWRPLGKNHLVSNYGRVWSVYRAGTDGRKIGGILIGPWKSLNVPYVTLTMNEGSGHEEARWRVTVARAVYEAFVGPVPPRHTVVHKNNDQTDFSPENLSLRETDYNRGGAVPRKKATTS